MFVCLTTHTLGVCLTNGSHSAALQGDLTDREAPTFARSSPAGAGEAKGEDGPRTEICDFFAGGGGFKFGAWGLVEGTHFLERL